MADSEAWHNVEMGQVLSLSNNAEGDCLFVAISQQLDGEVSSIQLRELAVNYLSEHMMELEGKILSLGWEMLDSGEIPIPLEGDVLIDAVLQTLSNPHTWGGAECLAALSLALNRGIRVFQEDGPTVNFPEGDLPPLRILLRYPRSGNRRTHYESVLRWRPGAKPDQVQPPSTNPPPRTCDVSTQTIEAPASARPEVCNPTQRCSQDLGGTRRRSDSEMVLRPRPGLPSLNQFRNEDFSDEEEFVPDPQNLVQHTTYKKCRMCRHHVGKYVLLNCGAFPVCGACIRTWYVNIQGAPCPHCGRAVSGWTKVFNQH